MKSSPTPPNPAASATPSRRHLLAGAGAAGAAAVAATALPLKPAAEAAAVATADATPATDGYRESPHVLQYYQTARV